MAEKGACARTRRIQPGRKDQQRLQWSESETHRGKGGDFLDPLLVTCDLISWGALLAEPENPTGMMSIEESKHGEARWMWARTYVFRRGCTVPDEGDEPAVLVSAGSGSRFVKEVEMRRLAGRRGLEGSCWVVVVVFWDCCDELKRVWD